MRSSKLVVLASSALAFLACAHEDHRTPAVPAGEVRSAPRAAESLQYLVADPLSPGAASFFFSLANGGARGIVIDRRRVVVGRGEPRVAAEATDEPIAGAQRIPSRFGGGFLFWTSKSIYRATAFDAPLVPVARMPEGIDAISFGPSSLLARATTGERWALGLPKGERVPITPVGAADVVALDDGRALGFDNRGTVFTSTDGGAHWTDATTQVKGTPARVVQIGEELWLHDSNTNAMRLELDGQLSWFDKAPDEKPPEIRPKDPRWRGTEPPLRLAFRGGAAVDDTTALILEGGDLARVDIRTGEVLSLVAGKLPPDALCEALPSGGDVLFACVPKSPGGSAFVVSHSLSGDPFVEQTFTTPSQFYSSDDGGIAYGGPCQGVPAQPSSVPAVCVRGPGGHWEEHDLSGFVPDAGASPDITVARWVPRADGRVVAVITEPTPGIYDVATGGFQVVPDELRDYAGAAPALAQLRKRPRGGARSKTWSALTVLDGTWSYVGNVLRGWPHHGEGVEIAEDGKLTRSPYAFDAAFAGAQGIGRSKDGRLYQTSDHGGTWAEVATPPSGGDAIEILGCTSAGCDLGAFYRAGWAIRPPRADPSVGVAVAPPVVRRVRGLELSCRAQGSVTSKTLARTDTSPEDLGLGAARLATANDKTEWTYLRLPVPRTIVNAVHAPNDQDGDFLPTLRAMLSGYGTTKESDVITVAGPNKSALGLRRGVSWVAPFDPSGKIVRSGIAMSDVVAAGHRVGLTSDEVLSEDFTELGTFVSVTPADPGAPSDVVMHNTEHNLLAVLHGERVRVAVRTPHGSGSTAFVLSGVQLPGDETAFLEVEPEGPGRVFKLGSGGISDLFDVASAATEAYAANPDALAVGPKGELAILRLPSGADPASAFDPAFLVMQALPPIVLAPWSEVKLADDPACKAEPGGYRATLQLIAPWIRVTTPDLKVEEAPMIARVRWTAKRVCLEGFEVRLAPVSARPPGPTSMDATLSTWLVGKGSTFARVGTGEGVEWRQSLDCAIVP